MTDEDYEDEDEYEYEYEYEEEYEYEDEDEAAEPRDSAPLTGYAIGFLAMVPLLIAYEFTGPGYRSTAEILMLKVFAGLGDADRFARWAVVLVLAGSSFAYLRKLGTSIGPTLGRILFEGIALALLLGPALVGLMHLFGVQPPEIADPASPPAGSRAAFVFGAAAWEELLFRVIAYSALYLLVRRGTLLVGGSERAAGITGEAIALLGSAWLFAAAHLAIYTTWLGPGGEPFDRSVFVWRILAGVFLGLIYRWRGPGVAAWTHGSFNVALLVGAGPDVFL